MTWVKGHPWTVCAALLVLALLVSCGKVSGKAEHDHAAHNYDENVEVGR
jgi:hypothetical protein